MSNLKGSGGEQCVAIINCNEVDITVLCASTTFVTGVNLRQKEHNFPSHLVYLTLTPLYRVTTSKNVVFISLVYMYKLVTDVHNMSMINERQSLL